MCRCRNTHAYSRKESGFQARGGGGGGGTQVQRKGRTRVTHFAEEGVFLRPPHVRDYVKGVWGVKIPL